MEQLCFGAFLLLLWEKSDLDDPAHVVGHHAGLHAVNGVVELLAESTHVAVVDDNVLALIAQVADGGDDAGGTGGPGLLERAVLAGSLDVIDGELALGYLVAPLLQQSDGAVTGDAGEDGAAQRSGNDLIVDHEEGVGGANLLHVLVVPGIQPQHFLAAGLQGLLGGAHAAGVVAAHLGKAGAAHSGADVLILHIDVAAGEAAAVDVVVGTHGAENDDEVVVLSGLHGEAHLVGDDVGADVESGAGGGGNPVLVGVDGGLYRLDEQLFVHEGDAHTLVGAVETLGVHVGTEEVDLAVGGAVGLHALKHHLGVVEDAAGGVQADGAVGNDLAVVPALALVVVHDEHVVGEVLAKAQIALIRLGLGMGGAGHRKRVGHDAHPSSRYVSVFSLFFLKEKEAKRTFGAKLRFAYGGIQDIPLRETAFRAKSVSFATFLYS